MQRIYNAATFGNYLGLPGVGGLCRTLAAG